MYINGWFKKVGPFALLLATISLLEAHRVDTGVFYSSAPVFVFVTLIAIVNGTIEGVIGAIVASAYAIYVTPDTVRGAIVVLSYAATVAMIGYLNRRVKETDTVENLIHRIQVVHSLLLSNLVNWPDMDDGEKWRMVERVNEEISGVMVMVRGWHRLSRMAEEDKE